MEDIDQTYIDEQIDMVKDAAANGRLDRVETVHSEAKIEATKDLLVSLETARISRPESVNLEQLGKDVNGLMGQLTPKEREEAQARADERLDDLIDF